MASDDQRFVLVLRQTRLEELVARFNTEQQTRFYIEHLGADFEDYVNEARLYQAMTVAVETSLRAVGRVHRLDRRYLPNYVFGPDDIVVVLGQDGLVANTLKYLSGQHVLGVNPDPKRWDGVLLPFSPVDLPMVLPEAIARTRPINRVTMAKATLNTGLQLYAVNDLFIGPRSHVSARYVLRADGREERQSSSGIIVSTGLGSTGWLRSLFAGWSAVATARGLDVPTDGTFPWDASMLSYFVREPFPSRTTGATLVSGWVTTDKRMEVLSEMPENGVIFSDGIEADFLEFNAGTKAEIAVAERVGLLVG